MPHAGLRPLKPARGGDTIPGLVMTKKASTESEAVTITLAANSLFVRPIRNFLRALTDYAEYEQQEADSLALVATELVNNSIEHGSHSSRDRVEITVLVTGEGYRLEVSDAGSGGQQFADRAQELAKKKPSLESPRGRGLFLVASIVDELMVHFDPDQGTRVTVSKIRNL